MNPFNPPSQEARRQQPMPPPINTNTQQQRSAGLPRPPTTDSSSHPPLPRNNSNGPVYGEPPGGSFAAYAAAENANRERNAGGSQRPGMGPIQVSFQEPSRGEGLSGGQGGGRSGPSRDSIKKDPYSDRRSSAGETSMMPELRRSSSNFNNNQLGGDPELGGGFSNANFKRKKSLVRPDRERMDPSHRQWYYRNHAAQMDSYDANGEGARRQRVDYMPSTTGHLPRHGAAPQGMGMASMAGPGGGLSGLGVSGSNNGYGQEGHYLGETSNIPPGGLGRAPGGAGGLRRGRSILARDEDAVESGINFLKRGMSLRRSKSQNAGGAAGRNSKETVREVDEGSRISRIAPGPVGPWMIYCYFLTICCPGLVLSCFGIRTPEQQRAWREKMGLMSIIISSMAAVGFLTFGFTRAVCPPQSLSRYVSGMIDVGSMTFNGYDYDFDSFVHPNVPPFQLDGIYNSTKPIYSEPWSSGGQDGTLLFQTVGGACDNIITSKTNAAIDNYYPCQLTKQDGSPGYANANPSMCHPTATTNNFYNDPKWLARKKGQVYFTWDNVTNEARNLGVWKGAVLDYGRLGLLSNTLNYPELFNDLKVRNENWAGKDATAGVMKLQQDATFDCLEQITRVGFIDSESIGCVASKVELYLALVIIIGVVAIKFFMAVIFGWFLSWRLGNYANETYEQRMKRAEEIEKWSEDIYRPAPAGYRPNAAKRKSFFPTTSRFSQSANTMLAAPKGGRGLSEKGALANGKRNTRLGVGSPMDTPPGSPSLQGVRSSASLAVAGAKSNELSFYGGHGSRRSSFSNDLNNSGLGPCPFPLHNIVPQPSSDWQPFNFPLAYSICLVTAYSESFEGLRTTLDSLATTDYPNSHKMILVVADGIVKGAGSDISTPDICLSMMKDLVIPAEEVEGNSYVAIADGFKRHNMAKVYAGFYEYDDDTVERSKQQRVPMVLVAKCGSPLEADSAKPGNRGKRDSQVMLMAFMQKVMFDERMTTFEYEFFNSIWRVTGVSPDHYEIVLMVDADTKVFPDSLTRMVSCMVEDPEIMGLCGETKIANKTETWVTMIQVFEYYISHHQTKAFEACFGGVTCLPGCFSAYRIKAPKGPNGYWVPILANPDIVEHYSENVVDTLHKKNLLLLGEDRYLTTLMLKTFPKRKMMFVPQAVCKTIVPDTFRILLSQRRRWINSTVHNLSELILVNDLCGTFCFSMRFVIFMELAGTLVLPAAIAFTIYVIASAISAAFTHRPIPVIPLVLLGVILGLPGLLIVVTSRKIAYVGWMLIYLASLPIWNFVLPAYAFWHMDDFSWGATRVVQGDKKESGHGDTEGKFDPSDIVMKRWADFERERRWRSGTHSRDSTYDVVQRTGSPDRAGSTRYSVVSSDTYHSNPSTAQHEAMFGRGGLLSGAASHGQESSDQGHARGASGSARARLDSVPLLELPAPLGPNAAGGKPKSTPGSVTVARPRESSPAASSTQHSSNATHSQYGERYGQPVGVEYQDEENRPMMSSGASSPDPENRAPFAVPTPRNQPNLQPQEGSDVRHGSVSSEQCYPGVSEAAFHQNAYTAEPEDATGAFPSSGISPNQQPQRRPTREQPPNAQGRGFSLVDDGPVASSQGVRQITRGARRMSAQSPISPQSTGNTRRGHNNADSLPSNNFLDNLGSPRQ